MTLQEQFETEKKHLPKGWHWLMDILYNSVKIQQDRYLKKVEDVSPGLGGYQVKWDTSDKPFFNLIFLQTKEKFASLRIYADIEPVEHDWEVFSKDHYDKSLTEIRGSIFGKIDILETISTNICQVSGERGSIRNVNGWLVTLSDAEYAKYGK